jgi:hypothetical protein
LAISGGSSHNEFNVEGTPANAQTFIFTGSGNDSVVAGGQYGRLAFIDKLAVYGSTGTTLRLNDRGDRDVINRKPEIFPDDNLSTDPKYTIAANQVFRTDTVILSDPFTGEVIDRAFPRTTISYYNVASLIIDGGASDNTFDVVGNPADIPVTLNAGAGKDTVRVGAATNGLRDVRGTLAIHGEGKTNTLTIDDQAGTIPRAFELTATALAWPGGQVGYSNVASLALKGGRGDDRFNLQATATITTVNAGGGNDVVLGGGNATVTGDAGRDLLIRRAGLGAINGGAGEDILVGGSTAYDATPAALDAIMSEWTRTDLPYSGRVHHLLFGEGANGAVLLDRAAFASNGLVNTLFGTAELDLFYGKLGRDNTDWDRNLGEVFVDPDAIQASTLIDVRPVNAHSMPRVV